MGASPRPTWRRALSDTRGRLKPEYDAVVVGAGKVGWAGVEGREGSLPRILGWSDVAVALGSCASGLGPRGWSVRPWSLPVVGAGVLASVCQLSRGTQPPCHLLFLGFEACLFLPAMSPPEGPPWGRDVWAQREEDRPSSQLLS